MSEAAERFTHKAGVYARYRWDYSSQAIDELCSLAGISTSSVVADIGAGTGMLSRHFLPRVETLYAVEPNREMRGQAIDLFGLSPGPAWIDGTAEEIPLPDGCLDLIVVGRAIHWFDPPRAKSEFARLLKPEGWLAILQVPCLEGDLQDDIRSIKIQNNGWDTEHDKSGRSQVPPGYYFAANNYIERQFPRVITETWEQFFGRLCSLSSAPGEEQAGFRNFEDAAREVFQKFCRDGLLTIEIATQFQLGQIARE